MTGPASDFSGAVFTVDRVGSGANATPGSNVSLLETRPILSFEVNVR